MRRANPKKKRKLSNNYIYMDIITDRNKYIESVEVIDRKYKAESIKGNDPRVKQLDLSNTPYRIITEPITKRNKLVYI